MSRIEMVELGMPIFRSWMISIVLPNCLRFLDSFQSGKLPQLASRALSFQVI